MDEAEYYKHFWNTPGWAAKYPNHDEFARLQIIERYLDLVHTPSDLVLDCGCGRGWLTGYFARKGIDIVGIDPYDISKAEELFPDLWFGQYFLHDMGFYNIILCSEVLEHIHDKESFLEDVWQHLYPSGYLILTTPRQEIKHLYTASQPVEEWLTKSELLDLCARNGFRNMIYDIVYLYGGQPTYHALLAQRT